VLTVTSANDITWAGVSATLIFPFRQAIYVDSNGLNTAKSVAAGVTRGSITSTGEDFNGVYVTDADFTLSNTRIALTGNGRCDFVGYGAAVVGTGTAARLVIDKMNVRKSRRCTDRGDRGRRRQRHRQELTAAHRQRHSPE
jgi:hypothetical protein